MRLLGSLSPSPAFDVALSPARADVCLFLLRSFA